MVNFIRRFVATVFVISFFVISFFAAGAFASGPEPTIRDMAYGPLERDVLDFWKVDSGRPTPLVVYIHGGGFSEGGKDAAPRGDITAFLAGGVSYASISYPYFESVALDGIIRDNIARAIQFLRYRSAELNIDKRRIAVYGESAGAGSSLWLAFHDDLADPANADLILRESTRVTAAGAINPQATYDFLQWPALLSKDLDPKVMRAWHLIMTPLVLQMYHVKTEKQLKSPESAPVRHDLDMLSMMDPTDPPVYLKTLSSELNGGDILHHSRHPKAVKEKADAAGIKATLILDETPPEQRIDVVDFLMKYLKQ